MEDRGQRVEAPLVDAHAHIFTAAMPLSPEAWSRPAYEYPAEAFLRDLDRFGIRHGLVTAATLYGDYSDYTLEALAAHPRLRATAIVKPDVDTARLKQLAAGGVVGIRLGVRRARTMPDLFDDDHQSLMRRLADLGLHVELLAQSSHMPALLPAIEQTGVDLVVDHLGLPDEPEGVRAPGFERLLRSMEAGRTWVKVSASYRTPWPLAAAAAERLLACGGPGRLLWGSDAPFVGHEAEVDFEDALDRYERLVPRLDDRRAIDQAAMALLFG